MVRKKRFTGSKSRRRRQSVLSCDGVENVGWTEFCCKAQRVRSTALALSTAHDTTVRFMFQIFREFKVGRPQVIAGLMLLAFLAQCLWTARTRKISELEYQYLFSGLPPSTDMGKTTVKGIDSPFTSLVAELPLKATGLLRQVSPDSWSTYLAVPHPWLLRLPFAIFGVWLGAALWWVARRLFDNAGGYVALGLYCTSPALIKISSNIGPEILLAWSILGLVYTAIGVAHTLYAPPRKWVPRIVI